jgi:hypothetical protein
MSITEFLKTEEMAEALGDYAYASESGALLTAMELSQAFSSIEQSNPSAMSILKVLAANAAKLAPESIVVKVFADQKYGELKVTGIKAGVKDGAFIVFGVPVPSDISTSICVVEAGKDGEKYKRTELQLTKSFKDADGDESPVSVSFQFVMPAKIAGEQYKTWLESLIGKTKKALLVSADLIGEWKEPGQGNPSLLSLAENAVESGGYAKYQIAGWTAKDREKKDGSGTWTSYGLKLMSDDGTAIETDPWIIPRYFGFSSLMQRSINKGTQKFYLHLHGVLQQQDKNGDPVFDDEGNARMEAFGKINTIEHFPPKHKQATIAPASAQKQMKSAAVEDFEIEYEYQEEPQGQAALNW